MRFLGLGLSDKVPDAKTVWLFAKAWCAPAPSTTCSPVKHLSRWGYLALGGQIVDPTIIQAPRQHNSQDEKAAITAGEISQDWKDKPPSSRRKTGMRVGRRSMTCH
jgi:hypothetical protein